MNARLTLSGREHVARQVLRGQRPEAAREPQASARRTVRKWVARCMAEGIAGLVSVLAATTAGPRKGLSLRGSRLAPATLDRRQIAAEVGVSPAIVSRILKRIAALEPSDLIHIDIKKLGRFDQVGHRITGDRQKGTSRGAGLESSMSASTMLPALPSPGSSPTRRQKGAVASLRLRSPTRQPRHRRYASDDRQGLLLSLKGLPPSLPRSRPQAHPDQALFAHRPTARPSASSRPRCANGHTLRPMRSQSAVPTSCRSGCTGTTGIVRIAA
jgi:hypothetical protein